MIKEFLSRRDFLKSVTILGTVVGAGAAAGCGSKESAPAASQGEAPAVVAESACTDLSGVADSDLSIRTTLQYVDASEKPDQDCVGCQLYTAGASGAPCGTCTLIKGPIDPAGWCSSWVARQA